MSLRFQMEDLQNRTTSKFCPLCGSVAIDIIKGYSCQCSNNKCRLSEPMSIDEWKFRPIEKAMQIQLDQDERSIKDLRQRLDANEGAIEYVMKDLEQIASMEIAIILKDGTNINAGELARNSLEKIRNRYNAFKKRK
jgi:hypothetical protein